MSMKCTVFASGSAGNHAAIELIERGIIDKSYVRLLNTSALDVPDEYKQIPDLFYDFSVNGVFGSGKESSIGRSSMIQSIKTGKIKLDELLNDDAREVIIVTSTDGGSGSGSGPVLAKYFDAMNIPVHVFGFIGFADDARSISNTLKFFKNLPENVILHTIMNSHFLDYTKNHIKAELAANVEFAREVEILLGHKLIPSKQIIDDTDLLKLNSQAGYTVINHIPLDGIKNVEGFNAAVAKSFEDPCYLDCDQSAKRIGVMINASHRVQEVIDNSYEVVTRYVGTPIEVFSHIQPDNDNDFEGEEYIDIIVTGLNFPERPIKDLNKKYEHLKEKLNTGRKSFADIYGDMDFEDEVDDFNIEIRRKGHVSSVEDLFANDEIRADISADPLYANPTPRQQQTKQQVQQPVPQQPKPNKQKQQKAEPAKQSKPEPVDEKNVPIETPDLKKRQFVNTTVNQTIYGPSYEVDDVDIEEAVPSNNNPMQA